MGLQPEALAILQVFKNKNCNTNDFIHYSEFGDVMITSAPKKTRLTEVKFLKEKTTSVEGFKIWLQMNSLTL